jgi:hypothetical protein
MWSLADELVDLDKLYTSDIYAILQTYGVEACRTAIINEMAAVFGVYGIKVDYRHRTVIADYMVSLLLFSLFASSKSSTKGRTNNRPTREHTEHSTEQISATNHPPSSKLHSKQQPNSSQTLHYTENKMISRVQLRKSSWVYLVVVELVVLIFELLGLYRPLGRCWRSGREVEDCIILCIVISLIASTGSSRRIFGPLRARLVISIIYCAPFVLRILHDGTSVITSQSSQILRVSQHTHTVRDGDIRNPLANPP